MKVANFCVRIINFLSQKRLSRTPVTLVSIVKNWLVRINSFHAYGQWKQVQAKCFTADDVSYLANQMRIYKREQFFK